MSRGDNVRVTRYYEIWSRVFFGKLSESSRTASPKTYCILHSVFSAMIKNTGERAVLQNALLIGLFAPSKPFQESQAGGKAAQRALENGYNERL